MSTLKHTAVPMAACDFVAGRSPHLQSGKMFMFCDAEKIAHSVLHEKEPYLKPLSFQSSIEFRFAVPNNKLTTDWVLKKSAKGEGYAATLPANYIAECEMFILPDVLHPCAFADSTIKYTGIYGKIINYEWMRSIARRRVDALKLLQMVLDNTETGLSYEVSQALIVQLASTLDETETSRMAKNIRKYLQTGQICTQMFRPTRAPLNFDGILFAVNHGMDLPMRMIQKALQEMAPKLDAPSIAAIEHLRLLFNNTVEIESYRNNPQTLSVIFVKVLEKFKAYVSPQCVPAIQQTQNKMSTIARDAKNEMQRRVDQIFCNAMNCTYSFSVMPEVRKTFGFRSKPKNVYTEQSVMALLRTKMLSMAQEHPEMPLKGLEKRAAEAVIQEINNANRKK